MLAGETSITLTAEQYGALNAFRAAHAQVHKFTFDGTSFGVAPIESLRLGLLTIFTTQLRTGERAVFEPQFKGVAAALAAGDVTQAREIVANSGLGMSDNFASARTAMLALFPQFFPAQFGN